VAQQELALPLPRPAQVFDHVRSGAAQVADGFLGHGGDTDASSSPGRCNRASRRQSHRLVLERQLALLRSEGAPLAPSGAAVDLHRGRSAASGRGQDAQPSLFD
jgi:hypothetical protein